MLHFLSGFIFWVAILTCAYVLLVLINTDWVKVIKDLWKDYKEYQRGKVC